MRTYTPESANRAAKAAGAFNSKARYMPNLAPGIDPWPVSDHKMVLLEAWAITTDRESLTALALALATLDGVTETGTTTITSFKPGARRSFAWATLDGDASYCGHTRERWTGGVV